MTPGVDPDINPLICTAIEHKRLLRFRYKNRERIVEPHDYGIHKGLIKLFGTKWPERAAGNCPTGGGPSKI